MLKRLLVMFLLVVVSVTHGTIESMKYNITIDPDHVTFVVVYNYEEPTSISDYYALFDAYKINVLADGKAIACKIKKKNVGTEVLCENLHAKSVRYVFYTKELVSKKNGYFLFSYNILIFSGMKNLTILVRLPEYAAIAGNENFIGFQPANAVKGTDGRRIYLTWFFEDVKVGNTIPIQVYYEIKEKSEIWNYFLIGLIFLVAIILLYFLKHHSKKEVLMVLTNEERKIVERLLKERKPLEQRKLARELDMSKSKLSRILSNLEDRGIIKRERRGRSNKITLVWKRS